MDSKFFCFTLVRLLDYVIGNIGTIFANAPYIFVCASLTDITKISEATSRGPLYYVLMGVGIVILIIITCLVIYFSRKELKKTLK